MLSARPNDYGIVFRYQYNKKIGTINCFHLILTKFSKILPTYKGFDRKQANQTLLFEWPPSKGTAPRAAHVSLVVPKCAPSMKKHSANGRVLLYI